jgi:LytS/YehU family sensor histidine kinase
MEQRLSSKVKLDVKVSDKIPEGQIPPLLFIPFVENSFKHGISYRENSFIYILLKTENNKVIFECKNSVPTNSEQKESKGGVGITNIQKRLELIYGNGFKLDISNTNKEYNVQLTIPFKNDVNE